MKNNTNYVYDSDKDWLECLSKGKIGESEFAQMCINDLKLEVYDTSNDTSKHWDYEVVSENGKMLKLEVKTQKCVVESDSICIELEDKNLDGWFYRFVDCVDYFCFHKYNFYYFIKASELKEYVNKHKFSLDEKRYNGCLIAFIKIDDLIKECDLSLFFKDIDRYEMAMALQS